MARSPSYYTVTPYRTPTHEGFRYLVSGFAADDELLLQTQHKTESNMQTECRAWESRGAKRREA